LHEWIILNDDLEIPSTGALGTPFLFFAVPVLWRTQRAVMFPSLLKLSEVSFVL
jgi:hypothetical protein